MENANSISDLQAVDFALGKVLADAYTGLYDNKPEAYVRFLERPTKSKIFRVEDEDIHSLLRRMAKKAAGGGDVPDLPAIVYFRSPGITGSDERVTVLEVPTMLDDQQFWVETSVIPVELSYTLVWLSWDKPTLDKLALAWFCFVAQRIRKNSRFIVPYDFGGERIEIPSDISAPREIQADNSSDDQSSGRLWAARTLVTVRTQVLYGRKVEIPEDIKVVGRFRVRNQQMQWEKNKNGK